MLRTGAHVTDIQPGYVMVGDERIDSVCTLWAAGVQASPLGKMLGTATDRRGCVLVDEHLNPQGISRMFSSAAISLTSSRMASRSRESPSRPCRWGATPRTASVS